MSRDGRLSTEIASVAPGMQSTRSACLFFHLKLPKMFRLKMPEGRKIGIRKAHRIYDIELHQPPAGDNWGERSMFRCLLWAIAAALRSKALLIADNLCLRQQLLVQDVLYRGADLSIVWPEILATAVIGSVYFGYALYRFRRVIFIGS
jgi:hypothetical protein